MGDYTIANCYCSMTCPVCGETFRSDEPMDPVYGDEIECGECGAALIIGEVETVPTFYLAPKPTPTPPSGAS